MGGINSLSGLSNVSVDFRPTIVMDVQKNGDAKAPQQVPEAEVAPENAPQPEKAPARSVIRELDVLLLRAAGKSISKDVAIRVKGAGNALFELGVLDKKEVAKLQSLAKDASDKLKALDKFSGRELANALMEDENTHEITWKRGFWCMNSTAKAVKAAIEAQQRLSDAIGNLTGRLAQNKAVDAKLQNSFTEIQFQCDRRVSEIDSIVFKMYKLVQQDVVKKVVAEPQVEELFKATFKELMPREAIMSHGTAEAFELINKSFAKTMRPLAEKLNEFTANGSKVLGDEDIFALQRDMANMRSALENVRRNGIGRREMRDEHGNVISGKDGKAITKYTEVDSALLFAMERLLDDVSKQIADARKLSVTRSRQAFVDEVVASLSPERAPGGDDVMMSGPALGHPLVSEFKRTRQDFVKALCDFAAGKITLDQFDSLTTALIAKFDSSMFDDLETVLANVGFDAATVQSVVKAVGGLRLVKAQFREMMASTEQMKNGGEDAGLATSDVRRIMLGEAGLSNVIEARSRGFKPGDVDPDTEEQNIVGSSTLGSGVAGKTYLLTTKSGGELVFKPELDGRIGLGRLALGEGNAYVAAQTTANLNLATQDTAKAFGCEDLVVKYSVGSHAGQFGIFMEKAKGFSGRDFAEKRKTGGGGGIAPADLHKTIRSGEDEINVQSTIARKLSKLQWLDLITGQNDRHWSNYFAHIDANTHEVTVKGIDNDASFSSWQIGLQKYALDRSAAARFDTKLKDVCEKIHGSGGGHEYTARVSKDPGITKNADGSMTVDLGKARSPEIKMAIIATLGLQSVALPDEIDQAFYDKLMEMNDDPAKKKAYLASIEPRISSDALKATESRLDEAIAYAKLLKAAGKVYGEAEWKNHWNLRLMSEIKHNARIVKSDGTEIVAKPDIGYVDDFLVRDCPSLYKRDYLHQMLKKPNA